MFRKILLLDTSVASPNMGDEIIMSSIRKNYPQLFFDNYIYSMPTHTPLFSILQNLRCRRVMRRYSTADVKLLCGTNALGTNMFKILPSWNINIFNSSIIKGTVCLGVGLGRNSTNVNWYTKKLYKSILSKEYVHSVRDEKTKSFLESLGFKAYNTGCPTLWGLTPELCNKIPRVKNESVVFTLTSYQPDIKNDLAMLEILRRNYKTIYFWPQTFDDLYYMQSLSDFRPIVIAPNLASYDRILETEIDYVGNRLHGGIRAMQHIRRSIIISIDNRASDMAKSYSIPVIDRNNISTELDDFINSDFQTTINGINFDLIKKWQNQFLD